MPPPEFRPEQLLGVFGRYGVSAVLIGGFAGVIHGSPYITTDVDLVPATDPGNLRRVAAALEELHARRWSEEQPEGDGFDVDTDALLADGRWDLLTDFGRLDLIVVPAGTSGYRDLARDAVRLEIMGVMVDVASLADVIRSKEAADRDKDRLALPVLRRIQAEG
jgi:hypothetical protein